MTWRIYFCIANLFLNFVGYLVFTYNPSYDDKRKE